MLIRSLFAAWLLIAVHPDLHAGVLEDSSPIVVTATRTAQTADEALASITVITRLDIERLQARSILDLVRGAPGISTSNNGGAGKITTLFLRGTEADHLLVLIDGVKVGSTSSGLTAFQDIPVDQIERIEIVRGPRSSLYGSEAIGGVMQIFTRKGGGPLQSYFSTGGGSYRTYNTSAGLSGGGERGWYSVNTSGSSTEGFNACYGKPFPGGAGCFTEEFDKDGYRQASGSVRAGYRFSGGTEFDLRWLRSHGKSEFDGSFVNETKTVQDVIGGHVRWMPFRLWQLTFTAGRSQDNSDNLKDGNFINRFDSERDSISLQNDLSIGRHQLLTVGVDYQNDRISSTEIFTTTERDNRGIFAQHQATIGRHDVQISLRRDNNEQFGTHETGGLAWGYRVSPDTRFIASYGTAFKAPSFNELYFPGFGNPNLRPESSRSAELGARGSAHGGNWSLALFQTRIDDLIAFDATTFAPANIQSAYIRGVEAGYGVRLAGWETNTGLTLLDPRNRAAGSNSDNLLPRRAEQALRLDADRTFGPYRFGATLQAAGRRYDDIANTRSLAAYATLDLRSEYRVAREWVLQLSIVNVLDANYETASYYNQPGRSAYFTLRYRPSDSRVRGS